MRSAQAAQVATPENFMLWRYPAKKIRYSTAAMTPQQEMARDLLFGVAGRAVTAPQPTLTAKMAGQVSTAAVVVVLAGDMVQALAVRLRVMADMAATPLSQNLMAALVAGGHHRERQQRDQQAKITRAVVVVVAQPTAQQRHRAQAALERMVL